MLRFVLLLFICTFFSNLRAQTFKIKNLSPVTDDSHFPVISSSRFPQVAEKINARLQVSELQIPPGSGNDPFRKVKYDTSNCCGYVYFYEWQKMKTPETILSLSLSGEAMGAYPEGFTTYHNFDSRTGDMILAKDIFLSGGSILLQNKLADNIKKQLKAELIQLKKAAKSSKEKEDQELIADQTMLYEECLQSVGIYRLTDYEFYFHNDSLSFVRGRCSNHAMRAIDDLDEFLISFTFRQLLPYLSVYGKYLTGSGKSVINASSPDGKIYKGTIDNKAALLLFDKIYEDNSVSANYWFVGDSTLHPLSGRRNGNNFTFKEETGSEIKLLLAGKVLKGNRLDNKINKNISITLEEY